MFRLVTLNLNGIRSAANKGWLPFVEGLAAACMGVQELKAQAPDCSGRFDAIGALAGHFHCAEKKGYSGVGLYTRHAPSDVLTGFGEPEFDAEGRYVEARFDTPRRKLSIVSSYFPSGSSSEERQEAKFRFLEVFYPHLERLKAEREFILVGDINIAHREIDLRNWRSNRKNSGFLPEERAWLTRVFDELGFVDVFRRVDPRPEQYTFWSNRGASWANNIGWRIDYQIATPGIAAKATAAKIYLNRRFSDHAPLIIDYDYQLR